MKKIKEFFNKIFSCIGNFFRLVGDKIKEGWQKLCETKAAQKVFYVLGYIPNKISSKMKNSTRKAVWGFIFVIPLIIGFVYFFLIPFIYTVIYSLSWVENTGNIIVLGFDNYIYAFKQITFTYNWESYLFTEWIVFVMMQMITDIPIILIFSMIMAVILNSEFKGRAAARAIFFIPVIFNSQAIDTAVSAYSALANTTSGATDDLFSQMFNFKDFLTEAKLPPFLVTFLGNASTKIYDIISYSGIQILIFLSAIQSVPRHLYEAAKMEGATQYEMFWKITFPMVTPMLLAAAVYTVVDSFLRSPMLSMLEKYSGPGKRDNLDEALGIGHLAEDGIMKLTDYGINSAIAIIFTACIGLLMLVVLGILSKVVFYYDE